ncbi:MAG TPA: hypothetical protein VF753_17755 [Terriglobales bacterium]
MSNSLSRIAAYYRRNGLAATVRRSALSTRRALLSGGSVLFYCDLSTLRQPPAPLPKSLTVERVPTRSQLDPRDLEHIVSFWHPPLALRRINQRFAVGASLWLAKVDGNLAGFGWTLAGRTVEPHYFRLGVGDVHFFDFHVFPQFRGQGINPLLVTQILYRLSPDAHRRAFIEAARWNRPQLASLSHTPFQSFGTARLVTIFGRSVVFWDQKPSENGNSVPAKDPVSSPTPGSTALPNLQS